MKITEGVLISIMAAKTKYTLYYTSLKAVFSPLSEEFRANMLISI
jgi:hypothetical protein